MEVDGPVAPSDLSEKTLITAIVGLLEQNGVLSLTELGALLGGVLGPEATKAVKREFKGLKHLMERHKHLFNLTGKIPTMQVKLKKLPKSAADPNPLPLVSREGPVVASGKLGKSSNPSGSNITLAEYLTEIKTLLAKKSWKQISKLLRVQQSPISAALSTQVSIQGKDEMSLDVKTLQVVGKQMSEVDHIDWSQLISLHLLVCFHYYKSHYKAAVLNQIETTKCFDLFWRQNGSSTDQNGKLLLIWRRLLTEARQIAIWADMSLESSGQESNMLLGLQNYLRPLAKPLEKTPALLLLQNTVLRIYSHSNTTSNFNTVLKVMLPQTIASPPYPISDVVTWGFFIGRHNLYQGDYTNALALLSNAFTRCPAKYRRNKQLILTYLLPVYAMMGTYPKQELLERYQLMQFHDILEGVKTGNYKKYQTAMDLYERALDRGVYLPLRRLTTVLFRNLFKKTALILGQDQTPPVQHPAKIAISAFEAVLRASGYPTSTEETECIVTNLVATKKIRAYISHEHQVLVLAKTDAFPSLSKR
jgi:hypothetical protein